jgi:hypothetical protein
MVLVPLSFIEACRNLGLSDADLVPGEVPHVYFHPYDPKAGYRPSRVWRGQKNNWADATITFEAIDRFRSELDAVLAAVDRNDAGA